MGRVEELIDAIRALPIDDRAMIGRFLAELDDDDWDREMARDIATGRLDWLMEEALEDLRNGRTLPF